MKYGAIVLLLFINAGLLIEAVRIVGRQIAADDDARRDQERSQYESGL